MWIVPERLFINISPGEWHFFGPTTTYTTLGSPEVPGWCACGGASKKEQISRFNSQLFPEQLALTNLNGEKVEGGA